MRILIQGGRVLDPASGTDKVMDVLVEDRAVVAMGEGLNEPADRVIDAEGLWVCPGFIDLHTHLREPGFTYKETIATGTRSGAKGGFTTLCAMPNTDPVTDTDIIVEYIQLKARREGVVRVLPIGAITKGQQGETLAEIGAMAQAGACALSEDGKSVENAGLLRSAMTYAKMFGLPIFDHCEDKTLSAGGSMNAGPQAQLLGLKGISRESEDVIIARDIILAEAVGIPLHICHLSTKRGVELVREARQRGSQITAEVTPHHFTLIDEDITDYDGNTKMAPPVRSREDRAALLQGLKDGTIGAIATDHAPHAVEEKNREYEDCAFGIVGLETALPLGVTELVETGILSPLELVGKLTFGPAEILGRSDLGRLEVGGIADIAIVDPAARYGIDAQSFASKGKNTPFDGRPVQGRVLYTLAQGRMVVAEGELTE